jgi:hypothetical protein
MKKEEEDKSEVEDCQKKENVEGDAKWEIARRWKRTKMIARRLP